jgi:branched-chain amino acid transport system substrate-binding protein
MRPVTIGAALSQTGIYALQGQQALQGLRLWVEQTNALGGLFIPESRQYRRLALITYDDRSRRADVEQLVERLIVVDRVDCLIGPYSSGLTGAAAAIAEAHQKVLWNHGGSSDAIMRRGFRWCVHLLTPASRYFAGLFPCLLASGATPERVAIVQQRRGTFATEVANGARHEAERCGFPLLPNFFYPDDARDLSTLAAAITDTRPGLLVLVGRYDEDVALVRALARIPVPLMGAAAVAAPLRAFEHELGGHAGGWVGPSQWEPDAAEPPDVGPAPAAFVEGFHRRFGRAPDYPAAQAYAAGLIFQHCVHLAGGHADADLRTIADQVSCRTFYGAFRLEAGSGIQVGHETLLVQWQGGEKPIVWPTTIAQRRLIFPKTSVPP